MLETRIPPPVLTALVALSLCLLLLAYAIELWSLSALAGPVAFMIIITRLQIIPEERALEAKFGAEFVEYTRKVRRWL